VADVTGSVGAHLPVDPSLTLRARSETVLELWRVSLEMSVSRYHRQMLLPGWGEEGQRKLAAAHALVVGCGALGCAICDHLVRAGVGTVTIVDRDVVELTNLQRQTLFTEADASAGLPKAEAARRRLSAVNSSVRINAVVADFTSRNAMKLSEGAGIILDGTDNFETRYLINDVAVKRGIPYAYGGAVANQGMAMTVVPGETACLRCVFEEPPPPGTAATCDTAGVFGPIIAIIGAFQAADALRLMAELGDARLGGADHANHTNRSEQRPVARRVGNSLLDVDLSECWVRRTDVSRAKREDCPCCGLKKFEFLDGAGERAAEYLCGQHAVQVAPPRDVGGVDLVAIKARLDSHGTFTAVASLLVRGVLNSEKGDEGDAIGLTVFADGRAIVKGTQRAEVARSIYSRYVGG
jgi:molybdopterin-synthase adenylyltransferase